MTGAYAPAVLKPYAMTRAYAPAVLKPYTIIGAYAPYKKVEAVKCKG